MSDGLSMAAAMAEMPDVEQEDDAAPVKDTSVEAAIDDLDDIEEIQDADPTADEESEALDEVTEDEDEAVEDEDDESDPATVIAVGPPKSWGDEEAKALWVRMPPEVQRQVATREEERDKATQRILSETGETRKQAVEATRALGNFAQRADETLKSIETAYNQAGYSDWTAQDWYQLSVDDPGLYNQHKAYSDLLQQQHQQAQQVSSNARVAQQESFAEEQANLLKQHAPDVYDKHSEVADYLGKTFGYTADQVRLGSAADRVLAYKAMLYDRMNTQAQAKAKSSKTQAKPAPRGLQSSAGQTSTSSQRKSANVKKAFAAKPSIENAIDLLPDF